MCSRDNVAFQDQLEGYSPKGVGSDRTGTENVLEHHSKTQSGREAASALSASESGGIHLHGLCTEGLLVNAEAGGRLCGDDRRTIAVRCEWLAA